MNTDDAAAAGAAARVWNVLNKIEIKMNLRGGTENNDTEKGTICRKQEGYK